MGCGEGEGKGEGEGEVGWLSPWVCKYTIRYEASTHLAKRPSVEVLPTQVQGRANLQDPRNNNTHNSTPRTAKTLFTQNHGHDESALSEARSRQ